MEGLADRIIENIQKVVEKYPDWSVSTHISYAAGVVSIWAAVGAQMSLMDVEKLLRYLAGIPGDERKG